MNHELAIVPQYIFLRGNRVLDNVISIALGVFCLSLLAQVAVPLAWTPVPVTGQTFGVALLALVWGRKRALATTVSYFTLGGLGFPIFAMGSSGFLLGPTTGYLVGMIVASYWMGTLADWGWARTWWRAYLAVATGSIVIFSFGAFGLSLFIPFGDLWTTGVLPFLPGDFVKTLFASFIAFQSQRSLERIL